MVRAWAALGLKVEMVRSQTKYLVRIYAGGRIQKINFDDRQIATNAITSLIRSKKDFECFVWRNGVIIKKIEWHILKRAMYHAGGRRRAGDICLRMVPYRPFDVDRL